MPKLKYSKEECKNRLLDLQNEVGWDKSMTQKFLADNKILKTIYHYWGNLSNMKQELNLPMPKVPHKSKYTDEELIAIIKDFEKKYNYFPNIVQWEKISSKLGLPADATYIDHFGSWHRVRELCDNHETDFMIEKDGTYVNKYSNKDELNRLLNDYYNTYKKVPFLRELCKENNYNLSKHIKKFFGSYENFVKENGYEPKTKQVYSDQFLEEVFRIFIKENNRVPTIRELKERDDMPTATVYVKRFGSWGKACLHYGYTPNGRQPEYYLENGERCDSSYECMVSNWLIGNNIDYIRNVKYNTLDNIYKYSGLMNCDYAINFNNKKWYVEIVGMLFSKEYVPTSSETIKYKKKLKKKEEILRDNNLNYKFIYANEFQNNTIEQLFSFLYE